MELLPLMVLLLVILLIGWAGKAWRSAIAEYKQLAGLRKSSPRVLSVWVRSDDLQGRGPASMEAAELIEAGAVLEQDESVPPQWWASKN